MSDQTKEVELRGGEPEAQRQADPGEATPCKVDAGLNDVDAMPAAAAAPSSGAKGQNAEERASFLSRMFLLYLNPLLAVGASRQLQMPDLGNIAEEDRAHRYEARFQRYWQEELQRPHPSAGRAAFKTAGRCRVALVILLHAIHAALQFAPPMFLKRIVGHLEGSIVVPQLQLWAMAIGMLVLPAIGTLVFAQHGVIMARLGVNVKTALSVAVFNKSLRLASTATKTSSTGQIVNIMSNDASQVQRFTTFATMIVLAPFQVTVALFLIYQQVQEAAFVGLAFIALMTPLNACIFMRVGKLRRRVLLFTDDRVKLMNEILSGIRVIKFYCWEAAFRGKIGAVRARELRTLRSLAYTVAIGFSFLILSAPLLLPIIVFVYFASQGHAITASSAFTTIALFNLMRHPFAFLPLGLTQYVQLRVSFKRIGTFLLLPELKDYVQRADDQGDAMVAMDQATLQWDPESGTPPTLSDVTLNVRTGQLVAVVGPVGSGKSTLLSGILGEVDKLHGHVARRGSLALVPQQPWIANATLRDNVLFGKEKDERRYAEAVRVSALEPDLKILRGGDLCEIGERGINLSGGQKARVSLARAVYADADLYLLDDPLSAVDSHVAAHLFTECIRGALAGKTRVFVTNQLQFLPQCDWVVVMADGRVQDQGTFEELSARGVNLSQFVTAPSEEQQGVEEVMGEEVPTEVSSPDSTRDERAGSTASTGEDKRRRAKSSEQASVEDARRAEGRLTEVEERAEGDVDWAAYRYYLIACGVVGVTLLLIIQAAERACELGGPFWIVRWSEATADAGGSQTKSDRDYYMAIYATWGGAGLILIILRAIMIATVRIRAARVLHERLVERVLRLPVAFFESRPIGRILNRFSRDMDRIDLEIAPTLAQLLGCAFSVGGALVAITLATKGAFGVLLLPILVVYYFIQRYFRHSSTEVQRLESVARSPIFAGFSQCLSGASTIRAFEQATRFRQQNLAAFDRANTPLILQNFLSAWLGMRLDVISAVISCSIAVVAVALPGFLPAGWVAVGMSFSLEMTSFLKHAVRMLAQAEAQMNAVERVEFYTTHFTPEAEMEVPGSDPPDSWPDCGEVCVEDLSLRYRDGPLVLKGLTFRVKPEEKVGVVGRTGAGKSSLMTALFRIVEPVGGRVIIDGVDTRAIGLRALRSRLCIIPQEPVLFSASLRYNIDPFDEYTDAAIWQALEAVQLRAAVESMPAGLQEVVAEGGASLSVGQRQLLCIARALLRRPRVLVMDEATASVDNATDALIQRMIRHHFAACTVLTIAHRLHTVMDSDRIMVMDDGRIAEMAPPAELLAREGGVLRGMVEATGDAAAELRLIAEGKGSALLLESEGDKRE